MSASAVLSEVAIVLAGVTSSATLYYGWRRRVQDAAKAPFLAGEQAMADAQKALEWRQRLIDDLTARVASLASSKADVEAQLAQALATAKVQLEELTKAQARLYTLEGEKRELMERMHAAEESGARVRARLAEAEEKLEEVQRKMHLGPDGAF